jgi:hypothetical protein
MLTAFNACAVVVDAVIAPQAIQRLSYRWKEQGTKWETKLV